MRSETDDGMLPLNIYIGYDPVERVAWHTLVSSILEKSTIPVCFHPVDVNHYEKFFKRPRDPKQSNSFSFTRFLVPYLQDFSGWAIFMDCDMLLRCDIARLSEEIHKNQEKAVVCVQHDYEPSEKTKYLNTVQYAYPRKNWSSFVLWNCGHPKNLKLTKEYVETASGLELHRFTWLEDEDIGELDVRWNWLVGDYKDPPDDVNVIHWTLGGPYFNEYSNVDFSEEWFAQRESMNFCKQRDA